MPDILDEILAITPEEVQKRAGEEAEKAAQTDADIKEFEYTGNRTLASPTWTAERIRRAEESGLTPSALAGRLSAAIPNFSREQFERSPWYGKPFVSLANTAAGIPRLGLGFVGFISGLAENATMSFSHRLARATALTKDVLTGAQFTPEERDLAEGSFWTGKGKQDPMVQMEVGKAVGLAKGLGGALTPLAEAGFEKWAGAGRPEAVDKSLRESVTMVIEDPVMSALPLLAGLGTFGKAGERISDAYAKFKMERIERRNTMLAGLKELDYIAGNEKINPFIREQAAKFKAISQRGDPMPKDMAALFDRVLQEGRDQTAKEQAAEAAKPAAPTMVTREVQLDPKIAREAAAEVKTKAPSEFAPEPMKAAHDAQVQMAEEAVRKADAGEPVRVSEPLPSAVGREEPVPGPAPEVRAAPTAEVSAPREALPDYARKAILSDDRARETNQGLPSRFAGIRWEKRTVDVESLRSGNETLWPGGKFRARGSMTKGPLVLDADGVVIDGNNRLHEAIKRGDKAVEVYRPAPRPIAEGAKVSRAADFEETGTYNVEVGGKTHQMYRDPESGHWYDPARSETPTHGFIGFNKKEATDRMVKNYGSPQPVVEGAKVPSETPPPPESQAPAPTVHPNVALQARIDAIRQKANSEMGSKGRKVSLVSPTEKNVILNAAERREIKGLVEQMMDNEAKFGPVKREAPPAEPTPMSPEAADELADRTNTIRATNQMPREFQAAGKAWSDARAGLGMPAKNALLTLLQRENLVRKMEGRDRYLNPIQTGIQDAENLGWNDTGFKAYEKKILDTIDAIRVKYKGKHNLEPVAVALEAGLKTVRDQWAKIQKENLEFLQKLIAEEKDPVVKATLERILPDQERVNEYRDSLRRQSERVLGRNEEMERFTKEMNEAERMTKAASLLKGDETDSELTLKLAGIGREGTLKFGLKDESGRVVNEEVPILKASDSMLEHILQTVLRLEGDEQKRVRDEARKNTRGYAEYEDRYLKTPGEGAEKGARRDTTTREVIDGLLDVQRAENAAEHPEDAQIDFYGAGIFDPAAAKKARQEARKAELPERFKQSLLQGQPFSDKLIEMLTGGDVADPTIRMKVWELLAKCKEKWDNTFKYNAEIFQLAPDLLSAEHKVLLSDMMRAHEGTATNIARRFSFKGVTAVLKPIDDAVAKSGRPAAMRSFSALILLKDFLETFARGEMINPADYVEMFRYFDETAPEGGKTTLEFVRRMRTKGVEEYANYLLREDPARRNESKEAVRTLLEEKLGVDAAKAAYKEFLKTDKTDPAILKKVYDEMWPRAMEDAQAIKSQTREEILRKQAKGFYDKNEAEAMLKAAYGMRLPMDMTLEEVAADYKKAYEDAARDCPSVLKAMDNWNTITRAMGEDLERLHKIPEGASRLFYSPHMIMKYMDIKPSSVVAPRTLKESFRSYAMRREGSILPVVAQGLTIMDSILYKFALDNARDEFVKQSSRVLDDPSMMDDNGRIDPRYVAYPTRRGVPAAMADTFAERCTFEHFRRHVLNDMPPNEIPESARAEFMAHKAKLIAEREFVVIPKDAVRIYDNMGLNHYQRTIFHMTGKVTSLMKGWVIWNVIAPFLTNQVYGDPMQSFREYSGSLGGLIKSDRKDAGNAFVSAWSREFDRSDKPPIPMPLTKNEAMRKDLLEKSDRYDVADSGVVGKADTLRYKFRDYYEEPMWSRWCPDWAQIYGHKITEAPREMYHNILHLMRFREAAGRLSMFDSLINTPRGREHMEQYHKKLIESMVNATQIDEAMMKFKAEKLKEAQDAWAKMPVGKKPEDVPQVLIDKERARIDAEVMEEAFTRAAAHVTRREMIDYQALTPTEKSIFRGLLVPFYPYFKQNFLNYRRWGWSRAKGGKAGLGEVFLKMVAPYAALEMWNTQLDENAEQEKKHSPWTRMGTHINLASVYKTDMNEAPLITLQPPEGDAFSLLRSPVTKAVQTMNPIIIWAAGMYTNRDPVTGFDIDPGMKGKYTMEKLIPFYRSMRMDEKAKAKGIPNRAGIAEALEGLSGSIPESSPFSKGVAEFTENWLVPNLDPTRAVFKLEHLPSREKSQRNRRAAWEYQLNEFKRKMEKASRGPDAEAYRHEFERMRKRGPPKTSEEAQSMAGEFVWVAKALARGDFLDAVTRTTMPDY